jgi:GTP-binding protein
VEARFIISAFRPDQFPNDPLPEVAFLGRSNVGKSSLLNALVGLDGLARTSATPGRTRSINFFWVEGGFHLVDLPGYGYARGPRSEAQAWKQLVEAYLVDRERLGLSILLLDARRGWMEGDLELKEWLEFHKRRVLVVATKTDKLKTQSERHHGTAAVARHAPAGEFVPFSAVTGQGVREIWQAIWKTKNP